MFIPPPFSHLPHRHPSLLFGFLLICFLGGRLLWGIVAAHGLLYLKHRLSCPSARGILVPRPGVEPMPPALEGRFLTTGPPGKPCSFCFSRLLVSASPPDCSHFPDLLMGCSQAWSLALLLPTSALTPLVISSSLIALSSIFMLMLLQSVSLPWTSPLN